MSGKHVRQLECIPRSKRRRSVRVSSSPFMTHSARWLWRCTTVTPQDAAGENASVAPAMQTAIKAESRIAELMVKSALYVAGNKRRGF